MNVASLLGPEILDIAKAIGLVSAAGDLNLSWFNNPLDNPPGSLESVLTNADQRAALLDLLDRVAPAQPVEGAPSNEKWHPLLGTQPAGNLYLTVSEGDPVVIGIAGHYAARPSSIASLLCRLPLASLSRTGFTPIAATPGHPFRLELAVTLNWALPADPISLGGIAVSLAVTRPLQAQHPETNIEFTLDGLDMDGTGARDVSLTPGDFGQESVQLLLGLIQARLRQVASQTSGEAKILADHLPGLLGLDGTLPLFPFATLASDPKALPDWLTSLLTGSPAPAVAWLEHLAALLGVSAPAVTERTGGQGKVWTVPLFALNGNSSTDLTWTLGKAADGVTPVLGVGLDLSIMPAVAPPLRADVSLSLLEFPLAGSALPTAFAQASVVVTAPALAGQKLIPPVSGQFSIDALHAGISWDSHTIRPVLSMDTVTIPGGATYGVIDLTNANTVVAAAGNGVKTAIQNDLGSTGAGVHLAALAGLVAPNGDTGAPLADPAQLAANPTAEIAKLHRNALLSSAHPWTNYFHELAQLLGLSVTSPDSTAGTADSPWIAAIAAEGPLTLNLVAWNAQNSATPADTQMLRLGLQLAVDGESVEASWTTELFSVDLPANGANSLRLLGGHHASVVITPGPAELVGGVGLEASSLTASLDIIPGEAPAIAAAVHDLAVILPDDSVIRLPALTFPFPPGFDLTNPGALGLSSAQLEQMVLALLGQELSNAFGTFGLATSVLIGASPGAAELQDDFPSLTDPAHPGSLFTDLLGTLRMWLEQVASGLSADGSSFASALLPWLASWLAASPPDDVYASPDTVDIEGSGTYEDPWVLPLGDPSSTVSGLLWLEPDGPPSMATAASADIDLVEDFDSLAAAIDESSRYLGAAAPQDLAEGLASLGDYLASSDGVVPFSSQKPSGGSWTLGTTIGSAHNRQPSDPSAISQILTQVDGWVAPGGNRAVILLGPAFADHTAWSSLLAQAETAHPGATSGDAQFNLRVAGVLPASIDLRPVTAVADFYTADLQDDGSGDFAGQAAQIGLVAARILELKPGAKLILVAHSTAGIAARIYAAANPAQIHGLITLATPHMGALLTPLTDPATGDALRSLRRLLPGGLAAGPLNDALDHLAPALDGYLPPPNPGALPVRFAYPYGDFSGSASSDTGGVEALAIPGQLSGDDLLSAVKKAATSAVAAFTAQPPTHLAFGLKTDLPLGPNGGVSAQAAVRLDAGRLALQSAAPSIARPAQALQIDVALSRPGGWLVGSPLSYAGPSASPVDVRVRSAAFGVVVSRSGGSLTAAPYARLDQAAFHANTLDAVSLSDAQFPASLGGIFSSLGTPATGSSLETLLAALRAFGICAPDPSGVLAVAADALTALGADAWSFLVSRAGAAFESGAVPGFATTSDGFAYQPPSSPFQLDVRFSPATIELKTVPSVSLATGVDMTFSVALPLATMQAGIAAKLAMGQTWLEWADGTLTLAAPPAPEPQRLYPAPPASALETALNGAVPWLMVDAAGTELLNSLVSRGSAVSGLVSFLTGPSSGIVKSTALGDGSVLDPAKLNQLLALLGPLPAGLQLSAAGKDPTTIRLSTSAPLGGVLGLSLGISIDRTRHLTPSGSFTLQTGLSSAGWPNVSVDFGVSSGGITLEVTPGGATPIELLPVFSGSKALASAAETLLPSALDALAGAVPGTSTLRTLALDLATALGIYDAAGGFAPHSAQLAAMLDGAWFASLGGSARTAFLNAAAAFFNDAASPLHGALPGTISVAGSEIEWSLPVPPSFGSGTLTLSAGWDGSGPTLLLDANAVTPGTGPVSLNASIGIASGALQLNGAFDLLLASLGISNVPQFVFRLEGGAPSIGFLPLGDGTAGTLSLQLLPRPVFSLGADAQRQLAEGWGVPLAADLLIAATGTSFDTRLWSSGPAIKEILQTAQIIDVGTGPVPGRYTIRTPLPSLLQILSGIFGALSDASSPVTIPIVADPPLSLTFSDTDGTLGIGLFGSLLLPSDSPAVSMLFGKPADWLGPQAGISLDLFPTDGSDFVPALTVRGLGVGLAGKNDSPLVKTSGFRMGAVEAYAAFDLDLKTGQLTNLGGGLEIDKLGLPLNLLSSAGSSNPVAASLFDTSGGSGRGDSSPANPAVRMTVYSLDGNFHLEFQGDSRPVVIPVHASFGPVYIDQIDLALPDATTVELGVDGSAKIDGLAVGVDDLALAIPIRTVTDPGTWSLDLQGLAVGFSAAVVEISGGLRKNPGPPIEYDGMLSVTAGNVGFSIVGAYSRPSDAQGAYTSLFMFVALPVPLGGPPFAFVMGLGGGFGYNRELHVPDNLNGIGSFLLVSAIDDSSLANDPMQALMSMSNAIPARRGAFWLAAGVRFTSFALVNSTVVVAVALDRGFEIDVLGISRMALPAENVALASVELALKARYNSAEGVLAVQAQLTDNSYLFTRNCQLTGGFAFFIWYLTGQFVLTLGGYHPVFAKPPEFPDVPRLGFHFGYGSTVVIKGGAYFALTDSCVMAGGSLSATAHIAPVSAWFTAFVDFLASWDPFVYSFDIGVEIGARVKATSCFVGCVTIDITLSIGARLAIAGPPFHGSAMIDAYVTTITIAFGDPPQHPGYITDWNLFAGKYLTAGQADHSAVSLQISKGLLVPNPPGAAPQPGTESQPWPVGVEFTFQTNTRMPATAGDFAPHTSSLALPNMPAIDLAPMDEPGVSSEHVLSLDQRQPSGGWEPPTLLNGGQNFTVSPVIGYFPEATWHWVDPHHMPAGARTISAVAGIRMDGHALFNNPSQLIPISTLVADLVVYALPLPFAFVPPLSATMQGYGAEAAALAAAVANASSEKMIEASAAMLAGQNIFSRNRAAFHLPPEGIPPVGSVSLRRARSAPPLVIPITSGLTMKSPGLGLPQAAERIASANSVALEKPRLRAVLQCRAAPVADSPAALHTSVARVSRNVAGAPRTLPSRQPSIAAARLLRVPAPAAPRPSRAAATPRTLRNASGGTTVAAALQQALDQGAVDLLASGVALAGGAAHVWMLPHDAGQFLVRGSGALRVVFANRSGAPISDTEYAEPDGLSIPVPSGASMAVVESLGSLPVGTTAPKPGFGAVTSALAPAGQRPAVGWQAGGALLQIGPARLLARGASLRLGRYFSSQTLGQPASYGTPVAAHVLLEQAAIETQLPADIDVVMISLDLRPQAGGSVAESDDLAIAVAGGELSTPPVRVSNANRRLLLYDVTRRAEQASALTISVASAELFAVSGIIGVHGSTREWATQLTGGLPDHFVSDSPLTPEGSVTVLWQPPAKGTGQ